MKNKASALQINGVVLPVYLGWGEAERAEKQIVLVDIDIQFAQPPKACDTDELADTVCYAQLVTQLQAEIPQVTYRLIEHLSQAIHVLVSKAFPVDARIFVRLSKKPPGVPGLTGQVQFSYWNEHAS